MTKNDWHGQHCLLYYQWLNHQVVTYKLCGEAACRLLSWSHSGFLYCRFFLTSLYHRQNSLVFKKWGKGYAIRLWDVRICGDEVSTCQLLPHRLNTSHIYNLNMTTVHRCLFPLGQVKDSPLEFLCSLDRLRPKDCSSVVFLVGIRQGLATPDKTLNTLLQSIQFRISAAWNVT